jgi:hypothetical protein
LTPFYGADGADALQGIGQQFFSLEDSQALWIVSFPG